MAHDSARHLEKRSLKTRLDMKKKLPPAVWILIAMVAGILHHVMRDVAQVYWGVEFPAAPRPIPLQYECTLAGGYEQTQCTGT